MLFSARGFNQSANSGFNQGFKMALDNAIQKRTEEFQRERDAFRAAHEEKMVEKKSALESADAMARFERERGAKREDAATDFGRQKEFAGFQDELLRKRGAAEDERKIRTADTLARMDPLYESKRRAADLDVERGQFDLQESKRKAESAKQRDAMFTEPVGDEAASLYKDVKGIDAKTPRYRAEYLLNSHATIQKLENEKEDLQGKKDSRAATEKMREIQAKERKLQTIKLAYEHIEKTRTNLAEQMRDSADRGMADLRKALSKRSSDPMLSEEERSAALQQLDDLSSPEASIETDKALRPYVYKQVAESVKRDPYLKGLTDAEPEAIKEIVDSFLDFKAPAGEAESKPTTRALRGEARAIEADPVLGGKYLAADEGGRSEIVEKYRAEQRGETKLTVGGKTVSVDKPTDADLKSWNGFKSDPKRDKYFREAVDEIGVGSLSAALEDDKIRPTLFKVAYRKWRDANFGEALRKSKTRRFGGLE